MSTPDDDDDDKLVLLWDTTEGRPVLFVDQSVDLELQEAWPYSRTLHLCLALRDGIFGPAVYWPNNEFKAAGIRLVSYSFDLAVLDLEYPHSAPWHRVGACIDFVLAVLAKGHGFETWSADGGPLVTMLVALDRVTAADVQALPIQPPTGSRGPVSPSEAVAERCFAAMEALDDDQTYTGSLTCLAILDANPPIPPPPLKLVH